MRRAAALLLVSGVLVCCNTTSGSDAGGLTVDSGVTCGPVDVSKYIPDEMRPPQAPHAGACTAQQIQDYAGCQGAKLTDLCPQFAPGGPGAGCGACIESQHDAPDGGPAASWGVIVFNGSTAVFNVEGCVDDALGQVDQEKANGGPGSCGDALHLSYGCQEAACSACTGTPIDICPPAPEAGVAGDAEAGDAADAEEEAAAPCPRSDFAICSEAFLSSPNDASTGACADPETDVNAKCAALFSPTPPADAASCFPDASIGDTGKQQVDWLTRIITYMCGP